MEVRFFSSPLTPSLSLSSPSSSTPPLPSPSRDSSFPMLWVFFTQTYQVAVYAEKGDELLYSNKQAVLVKITVVSVLKSIWYVGTVCLPLLPLLPLFTSFFRFLTMVTLMHAYTHAYIYIYHAYACMCVYRPHACTRVGTQPCTHTLTYHTTIVKTIKNINNQTKTKGLHRSLSSLKMALRKTLKPPVCSLLTTERSPPPGKHVQKPNVRCGIMNSIMIVGNLPFLLYIFILFFLVGI